MPAKSEKYPWQPLEDVQGHARLPRTFSPALGPLAGVPLVQCAVEPRAQNYPRSGATRRDTSTTGTRTGRRGRPREISTRASHVLPELATPWGRPDQSRNIGDRALGGVTMHRLKTCTGLPSPKYGGAGSDCTAIACAHTPSISRISLAQICFRELPERKAHSAT